MANATKINSTATSQSYNIKFLVIFAYFLPLVPTLVFRYGALEADFCILLERVASGILAIDWATTQHKFAPPDPVLLLYLFLVYIRPLVISEGPGCLVLSNQTSDAFSPYFFSDTHNENIVPHPGRQ